MSWLRTAVVLLPVVLLAGCFFRGSGERGSPSVPLEPIKRLPPPRPPHIYRLSHLDTLMQVPGRVLTIFPAPREVYEKLPQPLALPSAPQSAEEEETFDFEAEERRQLRTAGPRVQRTGRKLWLRPVAAKPFCLINNPIEDADANIAYEYVAGLPAIRQWLVAVRLYEGGYYLLIDQRSGNRTPIWGPPAVAPDGRHFVCGNSDVLARFEPSGLQLWAVADDGGEPQLLWERQTEWGCTQPRWLDNRSILFEQDFFDNGDVDTRVVRLKVLP